MAKQEENNAKFCSSSVILGFGANTPTYSYTMSLQILFTSYCKDKTHLNLNISMHCNKLKWDDPGKEVFRTVSMHTGTGDIVCAQHYCVLVKHCNKAVGKQSVWHQLCRTRAVELKASSWCWIKRWQSVVNCCSHLFKKTNKKNE